MELPPYRGPLSRWVIERLTSEPGAEHEPLGQPVVVSDPLGDDDLHLALFLCYELSYGGLPGVDDRQEWDLALLGFRGRLESAFESAVRAVAASASPVARGPIDRRLRAVLRADEGPSISAFLEHRGTLEHYREFLQHRSAYHLKEADPHTFAIPRLRGRAKASLVEIQADEYGGGAAEWLHARLFAESMQALGLDPTPGAYTALLPGSTLATVNLMSLFGLHRRLRGALVGHLAGFEMTSCIPNRRYGDGLRRLGFGPEATRYFDEHVEADAAHESIAANDLAGGLVEDEPDLEEQVLLGARALVLLEARAATKILDAWSEGRTSLRSCVAPEVSRRWS